MIKKFIKNIFTVFRKQKGFTLIETIISLIITASLIAGVVLVYQNNFTAMYNSIEDSEKQNMAFLLDNKIKDSLKYNSNVDVLSGGNTLIIDNVKFQFDEIQKQLKIEVDGNEDVMFYEINKYLSNPVFQINDNKLEVNFQMVNRHGEKKINKNYILYKQRYDEEYLN